MRSIFFYSVFILAALFSVVISKSFAEDNVKFIETTGRAVIENDEMLDISRRRALEDALYLAALHGGAKINGYSAVSTDTSIQENLVIQPASKILDYTIISEEKTDIHFIIKIRSAVGQLRKKECDNKSLKSLSVYKPVINVDPSAPFWVSSLANELTNEIMSYIKSARDINLTDNSFVPLDRDELIAANDDYDYISLTSGREKTRYGDYAAVLSISVSEREKLVGFTTFNSLLITFDTNVYDGSTYTSSFSKSKSLEALFSSSGPWRTINLLLKTNRDNIIEPISIAAKEHAKEVIDNLTCKEMNSIITVNNGKIEVPLGKRHGIKISALAVTKGEQTPFNVLRVEQVSETKSVLVPLNTALELSKLNGKSIQFLGNM
ncbi:flagellar assembly protein T N-terminal domain-containing protein [Paracoccaceae bacterium]|nr:flagellar assembly protein T N-terminal domain-containing protein [Paracoccaceae bacterium]